MIRSPVRLRKFKSKILAVFALTCTLGAGSAGCGKSETLEEQPLSVPMTRSTSWTPQVTGAGLAYHDTGVVETRSAHTASGPITGLSQPAPASREVTVTFTVDEDLGANGSISLIATVSGMPAGLVGTIYPALVAISDGTSDFINMARGGAGSDCTASGYYTCSQSACAPNPGCTVAWPSAYNDRTHWEQHQITNQLGVNALPTDVFPSVNTFPSCNWDGDAARTAARPGCAFKDGGLLVNGKLRMGTYTAKYVLLASNYDLINGYNANLNVTVVKKKDSSTSNQGAMDVNVVLVGTRNIDAAKTAKGQANLNLLLQSVHDHYNQANVGVRLGYIDVYEWPSYKAGDEYANVDLTELTTLFQEGSTQLAAAGARAAVNLFLVSTIPYSAGNNLTVLGLAGAIGGPAANATSVSGVAVSTFNKLATFNTNCSATGACPITSQETAFVDLAVTVAHEIGHYLGLNHPSESDGLSHDILLDTPVCTTKSTSYNYLTGSSCRQNDSNRYPATGSTCAEACTGYSASTGVFCPAALECQFNHVMWWTTKEFREGAGTGDGNIFSPDSGILIRYNPLVQ